MSGAFGISTTPKIPAGERQLFGECERKETRQIIVTTHNPNIVVGGDAEQVIVLEPVDAHASKIEHTGSIDDHQIIDLVVAIIEGGREAFQARRRRYHLDDEVFGLP